MDMDRTSLLSQAHSILQKNNYTKEDSSKVESLLALADSLVDKSELRRATMNARADELGRPRPIVGTPDARFSAYLRQGKSALTSDELLRIHPGNERTTVIRAAEGVGTGSTGGYLVPASFADRFETMLKATDPLFDLALLFETRTGSATGYPILDDTGAAAAIVGENSASSETDEVFASLAFGACPLWRSGYVRCSNELINDSAFDIEEMVASAAAVRFARGVGAAFVATLLSSAAAGVTTASTTAIAADEIVQLTGKIDSAYLQNASFLMLRSTYVALLRLVGSSGNFIFPPAFDAAGRPTILGFPVYFSPSMGAMTAGLKPVTFGDHGKFVRRQVRNSLSVKVLVELYALYYQTAYEVHWRIDGGLLLSGSNIPVAALTMHS
jgi:HK97 family phage major capsid protein